jgi:hypothetical protein
MVRVVASRLVVSPCATASATSAVLSTRTTALSRPSPEERGNLPSSVIVCVSGSRLGIGVGVGSHGSVGQDMV